MSAKTTVARAAGSSLINRLLFISNPLLNQTSNANAATTLFRPPPISSSNPSVGLLHFLDGNRIPSHLQEADADADALKRMIASPEGHGMSFPCGLPSLRFFIGEEGSLSTNTILNPLVQGNNIHLRPQILSNPCVLQSLDGKAKIDRWPTVHDAVRADDDASRRIASPEGMLFPCGLPSLRFFIDEGDDALSNDSLLLLPKRTYQPSTIKRKRTHGYLARKATKGGRKVIKRRIAKGRARIAV